MAKEAKMDEEKVNGEETQKETKKTTSVVEKKPFFKRGIVRFVILVLTHLVAAVLGFTIGSKTSSAGSDTTGTVDEM